MASWDRIQQKEGSPNSKLSLTFLRTACDMGMLQGTPLFMSIRLLDTLNKYSMLVDRAARCSAIVLRSELDFVPEPSESMICVLTYAIMLRHQRASKHRTRLTTSAMSLTGFMVAYPALSSQKCVLLWCPAVMILSATTLKNGFPTKCNVNNLDTR